MFKVSPSDVLILSSKQWLIMLLLGAFQIGLGSALYVVGLRTVSAQKGSIIALWEMILSPVWVAIYLGEYPNGRELAGLAIILLGLAYSVFGGSCLFQVKENNMEQMENVL